MTNRMSDWFIKNRHSVVKVFNNHIEEVNKKWELTGEPYSFGDYLEDINPEYVKEIQKRYNRLSMILIKNSYFSSLK
jgi:hypothetical protein